MKNVVLIGFPKSATSTLDKGFLSLHYNSFHHDIHGHAISSIIYKDYYKTNNPYYSFNSYKPYSLTQLDSTWPSLGLDIWPQLDYQLLIDGFQKNDDIRYIYNYRNPKDLVSSMIRWKNGDFIKRLIDSNLPGLPIGKGGHQDDLVKWINNHFNKCRELFSGSERFLEVDINSDNFRHDVEKFLGVEFNWWGVLNKNIFVEPADTIINTRYY